MNEGFRGLPAVDRVVGALGGGGPSTTGAARRAIDLARERIRAGEEAPGFDEIVASAQALLAEQDRMRLKPVVNATGVLLHTNLGRVPLGPRQLDAVTEIASGYSNLEYDLGAGRRGTRYSHARRSIAELTGAESALVVNNNAAAVLVTLASLCSGREVIISRGELIEIGGEFRIPDVMETSGARLVEVGTTNRTHIGDYEKAITPATAAVLKVHPSNYRVVGFTASVPGRDLARLTRGRGVLFVHDLGSGLIEAPGDPTWARAEPPVTLAIEEGADVVTFSGDKLLGGPQAGIIAGRAELIEKIERHPLMRALRVDKMTLAALQATFDAYLEGNPAELPLWQIALASSEDLEARARDLAARLDGRILKAEAMASQALPGGGSLPGASVGSWAVWVSHPEKTSDELARALRFQDPPVVARVEEDRLVLDLRTVPRREDVLLASLVLAAADC